MSWRVSDWRGRGAAPLTAPAAVSWAARLGWLHLEDTSLAFSGAAAAPWVFGVLAVGEWINDKLPKTPSRKAPAVVRRARGERGVLRRGGDRERRQGGGLGLDLSAGVAGAVAGTLGGYEARMRLARRPAGRICRLRCWKIRSPLCWRIRFRGFPGDEVIRRDCDRHRPGRTVRGRSVWPGAGMQGGGHRAASCSAAPVSTPAASRPRPWWPAPMPRTWRAARRISAWVAGGVSVDMRRVKARKDAISGGIARRAWRNRCKGLENCTVFQGHARFEGRAGSGVGERAADGRTASLSTSAGARWCRAIAGLEQIPYSEQQLDDGRGLPAAAPDRGGRQLCRAGIRADVPALRQRGDDHRNGPAADRARGRRCLGGGARDSGGRGNRRAR